MIIRIRIGLAVSRRWLCGVLLYRRIIISSFVRRQKKLGTCTGVVFYLGWRFLI